MRGITGTPGIQAGEGVKLWEGLTGRILDTSDMTALVDLGARKPIKFGGKWTKLETLVQLQSIPLGPDRDQALEAVIKIQEVYAK